MKSKSVQFKIDNGRVLVPIGHPCPFGCKYCYTRGGEVGPARVTIDEILYHFQIFASQTDFETIQLGYDGDPFADPQRGIALLERLADINKNVNFSTKSLITAPILARLAAIKSRMTATLSALVSFSCWSSAHTIEPHTPTPEDRMQTVGNLKSIGIPTLICIRPILPNVADAEYMQIVREGLDAGCDAFTLGPLYEDDRKSFTRFIPSELLEKVPHTRVVIPWSAHSPIWTRYEDTSRLQHISLMIQARNARAFTSSADAMRFFNMQEARA